MRLSAPKVVTWWIAVGLGVLGFLAFTGTLAELGQYSFWLVTGGLVLMALATLLKNL